MLRQTITAAAAAALVVIDLALLEKILAVDHLRSLHCLSRQERRTRLRSALEAL